MQLAADCLPETFDIAFTSWPVEDSLADFRRDAWNEAFWKRAFAAVSEGACRNYVPVGVKFT